MNRLGSIVIMLSMALVSQIVNAGTFQERHGDIRRVYVAPIELPKQPMVLRPGGGAAFLIAGPLGLAISNGTSDLPDAYVKLLADNKIDIAAELGFELMDQLTAKGYEVVGTAEQADAVISIQMQQYGLTGGIFSTERFPQLWGTFFVSKDGKRLWKKMGAAHVSKEVAQQVERRPLADYFNDVEFLSRQIRKVNNIVVSSVVSEM